MLLQRHASLTVLVAVQGKSFAALMPRYARAFTLGLTIEWE